MASRWEQVTLGRIYAIPVRLDATIIFVPMFFVISYSGHSIDDTWPLVAAGMFSIFLSILLHELGHAFAARFYRLSVKEIVVGGFYGYVELKPQAISRSVFIQFVAAGPFANLAIFLVLWLALATPPLSELWINSLTHLRGDSAGRLKGTIEMFAFVNFVMFVFNLLPAYPLDGGQILGNLLKRFIPSQATRYIVSGLGTLVGFAIILFGLDASVIFVLLGFQVVGANWRRLRHRRKARPSA